MNIPPNANFIQLLLLIAFVPEILFLLTQQKILKLIHPLNRRMPPIQVWVQLIPLIGLAWQFYVITMISYSIRNELSLQTSDSIFPDITISARQKPTYNAGILYAAMFCACFLSPRPLLTIIAFVIGLSAWIYYWVQLSRYKKLFKR